MKQPLAFHPPFFALFPVLSLYAANVVMIPAHDILLPSAIIVAGAAALYLVLGLLSRSFPRAAAAVSGFFVLGFSYGLAKPLLGQLLGSFVLLESIYVGIWATVTLLVSAGLWWAAKNPGMTKWLNAMGVVLVLVPLASIAQQAIVAKRSIRGGSAETTATSVPGPRRDLYIIVLDGYGRADQLKRVFGFDNGAFIKALKERGFSVSDDARSNYCQTQLSIASALNFDYIQNLAQLPASSEDRSVLSSLIAESRVLRELNRSGYITQSVSSGFPGISGGGFDIVVENEGKLPLFTSLLLQATPIGVGEAGTMSQFDRRRKLLLGAYSSLKGAAGPTLKPKFVFAHILAPHPPFVFNADGTPRKPTKAFSLVDGSHYFQNGGTVDAYKKGYVEQIQYLNRLTLDSIDTILKRSQKPPVILLLADHGSKLLLDQDSLQGTDLQECFSILLAARGFDLKSSTPIGATREAISAAAGIELPSISEKSFFSTWQRPYDFQEVTGGLASGD